MPATDGGMLRSLRILARACALAMTLGALVLGAVADAQPRPTPDAFRVEWTQRTESWKRPGIDGLVYNESSYRVGNVRLRVQLLDGSDRVVRETFTWVYGDIVAGGRGEFVLYLLPQAGQTLRIGVESFDLISRQSP